MEKCYYSHEKTLGKTSKPLLPAPGDEVRTQNSFARLAKRTQVFGLLNTFGFIFKVFLRWALQYKELWLYRADLKTNPSTSETLNHFKIHWFTKEDFKNSKELSDEIRQFSQFRHPNEMDESLGNGDICLSIFNKNSFKDLLHVSWLRFTNLPSYIPKKEHNASFFYSARTKIGYRGKGLYLLALSLLAKKSEEEKCHWLFCTVHFDNAIANYCTEKAGFQRTKRLFWLKLFRKQIHWERTE